MIACHGNMMQTLIVGLLAASWRDLVPWVPIVIVIVALSAFGIVIKAPYGDWRDRDDD